MGKLLVCLALTAALVVAYRFRSQPAPAPEYISPASPPPAAQPAPPDHEVFELLRRINLRAAGVKSVCVRDMPIRLEQGRLTARASGYLALEKEKNFRLVVTHRLTGREMDLGSNTTHFWYWSRRLDPPALHYARHEDLSRTMLRTALNPAWLAESLGVGGVGSAGVEVSPAGNNWAVSEDRRGPSGEAARVVTLVSPDGPAVVGRYLYDGAGRMTASAEYRGASAPVPAGIIIRWYEESVRLEWDLTGAEVNRPIPATSWVMPEDKRRVNIGE